jgi:hypothetical protein
MFAKIERTSGILLTTSLGKLGPDICDMIAVRSCESTSSQLLDEICDSGKTPPTKYICEITFDGNKHNILDIFRKVCINGHLSVVQWLVQRFGLTAEDARDSNNEALSWACENGHLAVAQWLATHFELTAKDVRANGNEALRLACYYGYLEVAQWLVTYFELTSMDVRILNNEALHWACTNGHLAVVQWLVQQFELTREDVSSSVNMKSLHLRSHLHVINWLNKKFGL